MHLVLVTILTLPSLCGKTSQWCDGARSWLAAGFPRSWRQVRSTQTMKVTAQFLIGRTTTYRVAKHSRKFYRPHNFKDHEWVYMRNVQHCSKPKLQKMLYTEHFLPLLTNIDPDYALNEDFAVQLSVYESAADDFCGWHRDDKDVDSQYMFCVGNYSGGELQVDYGGGRMETVSLDHRVARIDGRYRHRVLPFCGTRISVIYFKRYDRNVHQ